MHDNAEVLNGSLGCPRTWEVGMKEAKEVYLGPPVDSAFWP